MIEAHRKHLVAPKPLAGGGPVDALGGEELALLIVARPIGYPRRDVDAARQRVEAMPERRRQELVESLRRKRLL